MAETILETKARLEAFIEQTFPDADIGPGTVLSELLVKLAATVQNEITNQITALDTVKDVQTALASTEDTYSEVIDKIASNYETTRFAGQKSGGIAKIFVSSFRNFRIRDTFTLTQPTLNLSYVALQTYNITTEAPTNTDELQLFTDGTSFFFFLPVIASDYGSAYQITSGTKLSPDEPSLFTEFVDASAYGNFTTGLPRETDKELIARFRENLTNASLSSPNAIYKYIKSNYPSLIDISVIGANDAEMLRSKNNPFGISTFGKADVYIRTSLAPETIKITKLATKISTGLWEVVLDSEAYGFYRIVNILPIVENKILNGTLVTSSLVYDYALFTGQRNNEVNDALEARFTKYQKATFRFLYDELPLASNGDKANFEITLSYQPFVKEIQDAFLDNDTRVLSGDYLVKAVIPCFCNIGFTIFRKSIFDTPESVGISDIKKDIFNYVNSIPFGENLCASRIIDICHNYPIKRVDLPIRLAGEIVGNDNSTILLASDDQLEIPTMLDVGVSKKTTLYFIDYYRTLNDGTVNTIDNIDITLL